MDENGEQQRNLFHASISLTLMEPFWVPTGNLWYRQGLTPSYPQGSTWELISNNVTKVSVGPLDQVKAEDPRVRK